MINNHPIKVKLRELRKKLREQLEDAKVECIKNSYIPETEEWNPEHFKYCEGDLIASKLDLLDELEK